MTNKRRKKKENIRKWVNIHTNIVEFDTEDTYMCFMGC